MIPNRTVVGVGHRLVRSHLIELWRESLPGLPTSTSAPNVTFDAVHIAAIRRCLQHALCKQRLALELSRPLSRVGFNDFEAGNGSVSVLPVIRPMAMNQRH